MNRFRITIKNTITDPAERRRRLVALATIFEHNRIDAAAEAQQKNAKSEKVSQADSDLATTTPPDERTEQNGV